MSSVKLRQCQNAATETILEEGYQQKMLQIALDFQVVGSFCLTGKKGNKMTTEWKVTRLKGRLVVREGGGQKGNKQNATIEVGVSQVPCTKQR